MLQRMYHNVLDSWVAYMAGVFGYGLAQVNLQVGEGPAKLLLSMLMAVLAGFMGYVGKVIAVWVIKKIKSLKSKIKK